MSTMTYKLLDIPMSIEATVAPAAGDWQPQAQGYRAGPYRLSLESIQCDEDTALLHICLSRDDGETFALRSLNISFKLPIIDIHGTWSSTADPTSVQRLGWRLSAIRPWFGGGMQLPPVAANRGVPLIMLLNRSGQSRWLVGTLDQYNETNISARIDELEGAYAFRIERLPSSQALLPFSPPPLQTLSPLLAIQTARHEEYVYLSRRQAPWFEAIQAYIQTHDEMASFSRPPLPGAAWEPVFCTWYGIHKAVTSEWAESNAQVAAELGCRTFIMDDGWFTEQTQWGDYRYAGDWHPTPSKFPDFAAHVRRVQAMGLKYLLWVAPFMVGVASQTAQEMAEHLLPREFLGFRKSRSCRSCLTRCKPGPFIARRERGKRERQGALVHTRFRRAIGPGGDFSSPVPLTSGWEIEPLILPSHFWTAAR